MARCFTKLILLIAIVFCFGTTAKAICNAPASTSVSNVLITSATFSWASVPGAWGYWVSWSKTKTPGSYTYSLSNSFFIAPLDSNTKYYVFVRTDCGSNDTSAFIIDSLVTPDPCPAPTLHFTIPSDTMMIVTWDTLAKANFYEFSFGPTPYNPVNGSTTIANSVHVTGLKKGVTYTFCIRTRCKNGGISEWVCENRVATGINTLNNDKESIPVYPNPVTGILNIALPGSIQNARLELTNQLGQCVFKVANCSGNIRIDMASYMNGVYFIRCITGNEILTRQIIKQ